MVPPPKQHEILQLYSKGFKEGSFLLQKLHAYLPLPHRRNAGNKAQEILEESRKRFCGFELRADPIRIMNSFSQIVKQVGGEVFVDCRFV
ncbi:hypothetical protein ACE6H2_021577 [Prunus campanulata]